MNQHEHDTLRKLTIDIYKIDQLIIDIKNDIDELYKIKGEDNGTSDNN